MSEMLQLGLSPISVKVVALADPKYSGLIEEGVEQLVVGVAKAPS